MFVAHRKDRNVLGAKIPAVAFGQRFERDLVADPFNKHNRTWVGAGDERR